MPQQSLPSAPATTGGGAAASPEQLVAALRSLVSSLEGLVAALGGAVAVQGGGAAGAPMAPGGSHASALGSSHHGGAGDGHGGAHGMHVERRTAPVDRARAAQLRDAVRSMFAGVTRDQVRLGGEGNNHGRLPDTMRAEFARRHPGLPVPTGVVFPKQGGVHPVGVVYNQPTAPQLPMGDAHRHPGSPNYMQHVWFGGDLDRAYSDLADGGAQTMYRLMRRAGDA